MEKAPGTLMANAGGRLYVVRSGLLPSVTEARLWNVDPSAPLWFPKQEEADEIAPTGSKKRQWMAGASGFSVDGPPNRGGNTCAEAGRKLICFGGMDEIGRAHV